VDHGLAYERDDDEDGTKIGIKYEYRDRKHTPITTKKEPRAEGLQQAQLFALGSGRPVTNYPLCSSTTGRKSQSKTRYVHSNDDRDG
jgi:hypothetical protein